MKAVLSTFVAVAMVFALVAGITAADDKEVTLKGNITCAKCELKVEKKCATVIVVKGKDDKDVTYYFDTDSDKKYHKGICSEGKKGTVVGTVEEKDKKMIVTVKKLDFDK